MNVENGVIFQVVYLKGNAAGSMNCAMSAGAVRGTRDLRTFLGFAIKVACEEMEDITRLQDSATRTTANMRQLILTLAITATLGAAAPAHDGSHGYQHQPKCHTTYKTIYETVYEDKCETYYDKACHQVYETKYETEYKKECQTHYDKECETYYETTYVKKCETGYEQGQN